MKLTLTELKIFIFCLINILAINSGVAQNAPLNSSAIKDSLQIKSNDDIFETPFGTFNLSQTTGAVFRISGDELRKKGGDNLAESLRGRVPGLRIVRGSNTPGNDGGYSFILNGGTPFVLVDGQPRGLQVDLREVEEVIVLSDATFNSLLGTLGDNGLIYVVSKGGKPGKPTIEASYERGINTASRLPKLLSASEYATVINKAANNDGLADMYSAEAIAAYANGSDPIKYPNVDYQDTFLNDFSTTNSASLNIYGGQETVSYSAFIGYSNWKGLEKVGKQIDGNDITFRTKIKAQMNDFVQAHASVYGKFGVNNRPVIGADDTFNKISSTPSNAFPLQLGDSTYIVSNQYGSNLLSELEKGGTRTDYSANMIFDLGLDFDFKDYVSGLKYQTYLMMRTNNSQVLLANNAPGLSTIEYLQDMQGKDSLTLKLHTKEYLDLSIGRNSGGIQRVFTYAGNFSYLKQLNEGVLNLNFNHMLYYEPNRVAAQPDKRNLTFNLNGSFALQDKYIMYANLNTSSSNKFTGKNRTAIFPTIGTAWVASNEDFLKDSNVIDYLKFRTSYGAVGTEYTASSYYYIDTYAGGNNSGTAYFGDSNNIQNKFGYSLSQLANEDINWVVYNQMFAGFQLKMFKKLNIDFNYFNIEINGQVIRAGELYADALGNDTYLQQVNYTNRTNRGFNTNFIFNDKVGDFNYYIGANAGFNKITKDRIAEAAYPDVYRLQQGQADDNIVGLISDGLFTAENISSALPQFGNVQIGDIKYVDQNGDNVIDERDQRSIGNSSPRLNYGINAGFEYKGFNFDVVGMGVAGYDMNMNSMAYYTHYGLGTYFASVNSDLPNGNANPRLSTSKSVNNYVNSDYWTLDASYFRISNLEIGYTLPESLVSKSPLSDVKVFLRGNNLALFTKMDDLDPEDIRAGVFEYPMMRTFILGTSIRF
ncbi:MAG: SusC/RagA family TonB-linked outer membrane protein [Lutibacter sp.]|nr:SusC/RagA family TonB-linked outer membrane protein [Lutibacter sp.]MBP9601233.1 SusC/RagA family TonB-linked outer membrane protein [Lutibacter sp.]